MIPRVVCNPFVRVLLVVVAILGAGHSLALTQADLSVGETPHLIFSTYLGGSKPCEDCSDARTFAQNAGSDTQGNTYVTGATKVSDLPVLKAWQEKHAAHSMMLAFVAKYAAAGQPLWCTYLGGNKESMGVGVAVAGMTKSDASGPFPTLNAF
jgi:hypothetical protein